MGSDHIPPVLLKVAAQFICELLAYIFNFSHSRSYVPDVWKIADIVPVPKTSPVSKEKLRPISLLPIVRKV